MKGLYSYFGLLDLHRIDSPGHSLYQLGLIDSLRKESGCQKFDFFSYYPQAVILDQAGIPEGFPATPLGDLFREYQENLIDDYCISHDRVIEKIAEKKYDFLFLKARFRNLSTLAKKWKDARAFEKMIETAISAGYPKEKIIVLDTDLSLSEDFTRKYEATVKIIIPSIHIPGISHDFLKRCVEIHTDNYDKLKTVVFYGNIDTSNYKSGNAKSGLLMPVIEYLSETCESGQFTVISKIKDIGTLQVGVRGVERSNRPEIWRTLEKGSVMINVTKEKYDAHKFIPARIFEALIFGMIPVSHKFDFLSSAFSFNNLEDLDEIMKYLMECSPEDRKKAYLYAVDNYLQYTSEQYYESQRTCK